MEKGKRSRLHPSLATLLLLLGAAAVGAVAARTGFQPLPEFGLTRSQTVLVLLWMPLLYMICIAAHELGHVLAGRLVNFRTLLYIVGPLKVERSGDAFRIGFNRDVLMAGGLAAMAPVGLGDLRRRTIVMVAGGPLASLILGTQLLALYQATSSFLFREGSSFAGVFAGISLFATGAASLIVGLVTLLPGRSGGFYSDGARMLRLMQATDDVEREVALVALTGLSVGGTRPRERDAALVERGAAIRDGGPFEVGGRQFAFAHALDSGDVGAARDHLEAALERIHQLPGGARSSLLLAAATFFALYDGDAERARRLMGEGGGGITAAPHRRQLAEAAVRLAEGDISGAREAALHVPRLAGRALDRGAAALDEALAGRILSAGTE
ncbi:M50 family metallopeptidase [soil metagenome]